MIDPPETAGMMKNAFIPSTFRRSCFGTCAIVPLIFIRAEMRFEGFPVMMADPRSAEYSRYLESAWISRKLTIQTTIETSQTTTRLPGVPVAAVPEEEQVLHQERCHS